jgi:hypothetical protein
MLAFWGSVGVLGTLAAVGCEVWYRRLDPRGRLTAKDARMNSRIERVVCWLAMLACFGLLAYAALASPARGEEPAAASFEPSDQQILLHSEAQRHRVSHGRDAQTLDADLCALSQRWAEHMAATGARSHGGGENIIAWSQPNAAIAMQTWIHSRGHNAWLLSGTTRAGWGAAYSPRGGWMWVGAFRGTGSASSGGETYTDSGSRRGWFRFFRR